MEAFREIYPQTFLTRHLEHGVGPHGPQLGEMRATQLAVNNLGSEATVGSSFVKQGGTTIVAGVKAELGADLADLECHVELSSLSSGDRPGLPSAWALYLKQKVQEVLLCKGAEIFDLKELVVDQERGWGWRLYLDLYCVDDDGSVFDAVLLAAVAALCNVRLPVVVWSPTDKKFIQSSAEHVRLKIRDFPVSLTFAVLDQWIVSDPSHDEEAVSASSVTVVWNQTSLVCVEKRGGQAVGAAQLQTCLATAQKRRDEMLPRLKEQAK